MKPGFWLACAGFVGIAVLCLWEEHRIHLLGALPYILILLCPLMHLFMHHGHGGHGGHGDHCGHDHGASHEEGPPVPAKKEDHHA